MDNEHNAYGVTNATDDTYQVEFDSLNMENGFLFSEVTGDLDDIKTIVSELPLLQQFKLYELINKDIQFTGYSMNTINDCLLDFTSEYNISEVSTDEKQDFNDEFYINYLDESIGDLKYYSNSFDMFDLLEFLSNSIESFQYSHIIGYCQGDECLIFNNDNFTYDETTKNYITCVLYGGLVEINSLDNDLNVYCTDAVLSNDYSLEYDQDKIINYMNKHYNAKPANKVVSVKLAFA